MERFELLQIELLDVSESAVKGFTENVSRSGACISVETISRNLDLVRVVGVTLQFASRAFVRNRIQGADNRERLCLQFVDAPFPV